MKPHKICYFAGTAGDWGGASRVLFTNLRFLDRARFEPVVLLSGHGPAEQLLEQLGISYQVWGALTEPHRWHSYLGAIIRAALWFKQHGIDLVHMNRANDWRPAELLAARLCRIPVIYHFHTVNHDRAPATRMATGILAVSEYVAEHSDTLGVPTRVIYNTVDPVRFEHASQIRDNWALDEHHVVVTFVGQIRKIKGIEDFVAMARQVRGEQVRFLIVGECRYQYIQADAYTEEELLALIACDERIRYCGYQSRIQDVYYSSDIVVVPSRWQEPFGLVNIEAGAAAKAVVATRVGGIPEVIVDSETGYLVDVGDVNAMAAKVQALVDDAEKRQSLGRAARVRVLRDFTGLPVRLMEEYYLSLIG